MTWGELLKQGQERLKKAGIQEYELDAWYLFEQAFHEPGQIFPGCKGGGGAGG